MPTFTYSLSDFTPFTKILSADMNTKLNDIKTFFNVTKLDDSNIQDAGITRATKLKLGTANYVVINSGTGAMSEEAQLALSRGGTNLNIIPGNFSPGDVIQINTGATALTVGPPTSVPASLRLYQFQQFS